ncbi:MAG TPA: DUF2997 domain-containing protein [Chloroflexi bacterium]|nr:DUF2997 domain-containing protein [Chloroflexota bacterium]
MTEKQQIEFVIKPDGTVEEKVSGVSGPACEEITEAIEKALGEVVRREKTPDYFNPSRSAEESVTTST